MDRLFFELLIDPLVDFPIVLGMNHSVEVNIEVNLLALVGAALDISGMNIVGFSGCDMLLATPPGTTCCTVPPLLTSGA